jgi:hypothetical protein
MCKKYNYIKNKSTLGVFFSGLFMIASTLSAYSTVDNNAQTVGPTVQAYVNVVRIAVPQSDMTFVLTDVDIANAAAIASAANATLDSEVYVQIGRYQACILSNGLVPVNTDEAGSIMKVTKGASSFHTTTNVSEGGVSQLALFNAATGKKIKFIMHVTPSGNAGHAGTYGANAAITSNNYSSQYTAKAFIIGGDDTNTANDYSVSLNLANATTNASPTTFDNLGLDVYGAVNQYGTNPDLQTANVSTSNGSAADGLTALEIDVIQNTCVGDTVPGDGVSSPLQSMVMSVILYANVADIATATAGNYTTSYTVTFDDISNSDTVYSTAS